MRCLVRVGPIRQRPNVKLAKGSLEGGNVLDKLLSILRVIAAVGGVMMGVAIVLFLGLALLLGVGLLHENFIGLTGLLMMVVFFFGFTLMLIGGTFGTLLDPREGEGGFVAGGLIFLSVMVFFWYKVLQLLFGCIVTPYCFERFITTIVQR